MRGHVHARRVLSAAGGWKLRDQIFDAVVSIPTNIAEGSGRGSSANFKRFLWYSNGSCNEFESEVLLAHDVTFLPEQIHSRLDEQVEEVRRMLTSLIDKVGERNNSRQ